MRGPGAGGTGCLPQELVGRTVAPAEPRHDDEEEDHVRDTGQHCSDDVLPLAALAGRESSERADADDRCDPVRHC